FFALREAGSRIRRWPEKCAARRKAAKTKVSETGETRVSYGKLNDSGNTRPIGGEIKYLHLAKRFPEHRQGFNVIYLVSSALPPHVIELVKAAKSRGAKLVWNQNGIAYPGFYGDFYPWFNRTMAALLPLADHVVYQSEFCRASADRYLGKAQCASEILFNPVDTEKFRPRDNPMPASTWELLCAGTNHSFYRIRAPLEAVKILRERGRNTRLTIAGEFRWRFGDAEVERHIKKLGLEDCVTRKPPFSQDEAPEIYRGAHLLLHGKDKDPCPTVPIEAMACGLPVVGLAGGGMPELVPPQVGRLVPVAQTWTEDNAADPLAMANAVEEIMVDHDVFSRAARKHAEEKFDVRPWLDRHEAIFAEVLSR
ncbi:MAG: glycosyltransferase family 4 protein, partial [Chthoniobacterales bacterium]